MTLVGRQAECEAVDRLLTDVREGRSRVVVLRGDAGVGKTALIAYLAEQADGFRILRAVGVYADEVRGAFMRAMDQQATATESPEEHSSR